jgi:hypothetical protein
MDARLSLWEHGIMRESDRKIDLAKKLDVCIANRNLEIGLFWQRSLFFSGFITVAAAGYGATINNQPSFALVVATCGFVGSVAWTLANRGSKYWQESWEAKVEEAEKDVIGVVHADPMQMTKGNWWLRSRRFSVSKLTIALSDFVTAIWIPLVLFVFAKVYGWQISDGTKSWLRIGFPVAGGLYALLLIIFTRSSLKKPPRA